MSGDSIDSSADLQDAISGDSSGGGDSDFSLLTPIGILSLVAGWLVTNFVIQPVDWAAAYFTWALETALTTFDTAVRGSLETAGSSVWTNAVVTPRDAIFNAIDSLVGSAGFASPLVVGILAIVIAGVVLLIVVVAVRYAAGYVPGGSYLQ